MPAAMNTMPTLATVAPTGSYDVTRFNALRHAVLSRYTVLPWEDETEYRTLLGGLAAEHAPEGPTEEHLVEELAGIIWRKRRLRMAEAAAPAAAPNNSAATRLPAARGRRRFRRVTESDAVCTTRTFAARTEEAVSSILAAWARLMYSR